MHVESIDKIINGTAEPNEPSVLALLYEDLTQCTGTAITSSTVLTAAHCIYIEGRNASPNPPDQVAVVINEQFIEVRNVIDFAMHPKWTGSPRSEFLLEGYDLALLYLDDPLSIPKLNLDQTPPQERIGQQGKIIGFGKTEAQNRLSIGKKHQATLKINQIFGTHSNLLELTHLGEVYQGACHGDSGGPFLIETDNQRVISGVTSYGSSWCDQASNYVSVAAHIDWILENLIMRTTGVTEVFSRNTQETLDLSTCFSLLACLGRCYGSEGCIDGCYKRSSEDIQNQARGVISCNKDAECQGDPRCLAESCYDEVIQCDDRLLSLDDQEDVFTLLNGL